MSLKYKIRAILFLAITIQPTKTIVLQNCLSKTVSGCNQCFGTILAKQPGTNLYNCQTPPKGTIDPNCQVFTKYKADSPPSYCAYCKQNFALDRTSPYPQCIPSIIKFCVIETVGALNNDHFCAACSGNYYVDTSSYKSQCVDIGDSKIENCEWGGLAYPTTCLRCKEGYSLSSDFKSCNKPRPEMVGCWLLGIDGSSCQVCDAFSNYSIQIDNTCKKQ